MPTAQVVHCIGDMRAGNTVTVLLNARAGSAADRAAAIGNAFEASGLRARIVTVSGEEIERIARHLAQAGQSVIVAGGDGTVSSAASVALGAGVPLGVVPLGTRNHFARDAGLPLDVGRAAAVIAAGATTPVDVGEINGRPFLNNTSIGIYPRLVWDRELQRRRGRTKWLAVVLALARTLMRLRRVTVHMTVDGIESVRRTPFVLIGNGQYESEGPRLGHRPSLDSGVLSVFVAPEAGRWQLLALPLRALFRGLTPAAPLESFLATDVSIEMSRHRVTIAVDGELLTAHAPLRTTVRRRALRVLTPQRG